MIRETIKIAYPRHRPSEEMISAIQGYLQHIKWDNDECPPAIIIAVYLQMRGEITAADMDARIAAAEEAYLEGI